MASPYDLAQMAAHDLDASRALPGPDYHEVLRWLHEDLHPATYVEIGVHSGCSLAMVQPQTVAVGIDPEPHPAARWPANCQIFRMASSEFFPAHDLRHILGGRAVDFALIDGLHLFEQALEDLFNLERYSSPAGVIAVHDTIPLDRTTSARTRTTEFYTGDVWKIVPYLLSHRPELEIVTVTAPPSGLTLIRGLGPRQRHRTHLPVPAAAYAELEFDYFERNRTRFLRTIPNHRFAIQSFCQKTPVQSIASG